MNAAGGGQAAGAPPVIPIQTCKLPPPRQLGLDETRESLKNWLYLAQNFFSRDDSFSRFVLPAQTWDPAAANFGFVNEGPETRLRRTGPEIAAALDRFFKAMSGFFPFNFLARRFPQSTSFASMKAMVYRAYNHQLDGVSLLKVHEMKRQPEENHYIFFERLQDYFYQHLVGPNINAGGYTSGPGGDQMSISQANIIAMMWLDKIDRRLVQFVQVEYGTELRGGTQLVDLIPRMASDMLSLLSKLDDAKINRAMEAQLNRFRRDDQQSAGRGRSTTYRSNDRQIKPGAGRGRNQQGFCAHCEHLSKELGVSLHTSHDPTTCRRKRVHVRMVGQENISRSKVTEAADDLEEISEQEDREDEEQFEDIYGDYDGGKLRFLARHSEPSSLQNRPSYSRDPDPDGADRCFLYPVDVPGILLRLSNPDVSDRTEADTDIVNRALLRISTGQPTRALSPSLLGHYEGKSFVAVVDSGAELNCLDLQFAQDMKIPFRPTNAGATSAGLHKIPLVGVTTSDFVFWVDFRGRSIPVNLQHAVVVDALGSDVLLGEPAKQHNSIETRATNKTISIRYDGQIWVRKYLDHSRKSYSVARVPSGRSIYDGEQLRLPVPANSGDRVFLLTPKKEDRHWFPPGFYEADKKVITVTSHSSEPIQLSRSKPVGELRTCSQINIAGLRREVGLQTGKVLDGNTRAEGQPEDSDLKAGQGVFLRACGVSREGRDTAQELQRDITGAGGVGRSKKESEDQEEGKPTVTRVVSYPSDNFRYEDFSVPEPRQDRKEPEVVMDPDGIMPEHIKQRMRHITNNYSHIFTKRPGKYNGAFGKVDNSICFTSMPPPNSKVYVPDYSEKMKQEQAKLMDKLMDQGVLQRPEDIGVVPEVVSPSLLVPKQDPGEFRLVTDFSGLNRFIKKYPSTSPTIAEAKKSLARKKYYVHLDFSNYFFQSGIKREDAQYLGTFHPYKGLLCYVCMPQGLRNASEQGYEVLARVYGDMCQRDQCTRIADSLLPEGDTWDEICENYEECLRRADQAGLTFKPGKVIICPKNIELFGWTLRGSEWSPTEHTTSTLAKASYPATIKGLRSFLGAFKQFSDCVEGYAALLHELEKIVGGKASAEKITWTDELRKTFDAAKAATGNVHGVHVPLPTDKLNTYSDYSADTRAVGGRLEIIRMVDGEKKTLHGGYYSVILDKFKSNWVPCEAEAAGVRLTLQHFEHYIRESLHTTTHYTDNLPTVQAWKRCLQGFFSASSRIATFLVNLSALPVDLEYKPGKLMHYSDYASRHPNHCSKEAKCQICGFAQAWQKIGDNTVGLRSLRIDDILEGRAMMPYIQIKSWIGAQLTDFAHIQLKKCVETGQVPEKKKTKGDYTILKKLYGLYRVGDINIRRDGLVMVKAKEGHFEGFVISVPHKLMAGIAFSLHIKLGHPSKGQLASIMARFFYCPGGQNIIHSVVDNCVQCRSLAQIPKSFAMDVAEQVSGFGAEFAVDVIERHGQRIFLAREKLSQHTWLELIPDQTAATFRRVLIRTILPWAHSGGATVRCDGATALVSLAKEAQQEDSVLGQYNIRLEIGRLNNVNKNAVAENAVRECEKEILKYKHHNKILTEEDLVVIARTMNERIRNRGMAAREIFTRRDLITGKPKEIQDDKISKQQFANRTENNQKALNRKGMKKEQEVVYHQGDVVYIKAQLSKHQPREKYLVTRFEGDTVVVQKLESKFGSKEYVLFGYEIMPANSENDELYEIVRNQEQQRTETETSETDQPDVHSEQKPKRGRGRPRKQIGNPQPGPNIITRPTRRSAVSARKRWNSWDLQQISCVSRKEPMKFKSKIYRTAADDLQCEEDWCEQESYIPNLQKYWHYRERMEPQLHLAFPPEVNYKVLEEQDWEFPDWENWLDLQQAIDPAELQQMEIVLEGGEPQDQTESESDGDLEVYVDAAQSVSPPITPEEEVAPHVEMAPNAAQPVPPLLTPQEEIALDEKNVRYAWQRAGQRLPVRDLEALNLESRTRRRISRDEEFKQLARHPEGPEQVNLQRVCNLESLPEAEREDDQTAGPSSSTEQQGEQQSQQEKPPAAATPLRPQRSRKKPGRFDDFEL